MSADIAEHPAVELYVVAGEVLDRIRAGNTERNLAGVPDSRNSETMALMRVSIASGRLALPNSCFTSWALSGTTSSAAGLGAAWLPAV